MLVEERNSTDLLDPLVAMNIISPQDSLLIVLHIFHGHELIEIAEFIGVNYKTLCRRYERAIQRLRNFFGNEKRFRKFLESTD